MEKMENLGGAQGVNDAQVGDYVISTLRNALSKDFTDDQAASLVTMALYTAVFSEQIKESWKSMMEELYVSKKEQGEETKSD